MFELSRRAFSWGIGASIVAPVPGTLLDDVSEDGQLYLWVPPQVKLARSFQAMIALYMRSDSCDLVLLVNDGKTPSELAEFRPKGKSRKFIGRVMVPSEITGNLIAVARMRSGAILSSGTSVQ